jgi:hypothetical protein
MRWHPNVLLFFFLSLLFYWPVPSPVFLFFLLLLLLLLCVYPEKEKEEEEEGGQQKRIPFDDISKTTEGTKSEIVPHTQHIRERDKIQQQQPPKIRR